jgi:hypothetical protein
MNDSLKSCAFGTQAFHSSGGILDTLECNQMTVETYINEWIAWSY